MRAWLRERRSLGVTAVLAGGLGFVPGLAGPGYEIALVLGFVVPSVVAVAAVVRAPDPGEPVFLRLARAALDALAHGALLLLATLLHGLRVGFCEVWGGLTVLMLGPIIGALLAGLWGAVASELVHALPFARLRGRARYALALAGPLGSIGVGLARFYGSPMIFGYDPFVGYFSGTLYDTVLSYQTLATYRLGSAATVVALFSLAAMLRRVDGKLALARPIAPALVVVFTLSFLASGAVTLSGPALGHYHSRATITEALGGRLVGDRCDIVYARTLPRADIEVLHKECEAHVVELEAWWGERGPDKITAFVFESADQKGEYMGASGTNIAKPWRGEVYIQGTQFPHRVLGHELMHVVASSRGAGPFQVGAHWGGLLPNPGLIEGVAVAASPKEEDLSAAEWAKAMRDRGTLPPLDALLGLRFFTASSSMAYTASGAFVGWIHARFGNDAVRAWYGGSSLQEATGVPFATLEADWHASLDELTLDEAALVQAEAKFERPGFFARRCPRLVDGCVDRADALGRAGDVTGALLELEEARRYEPRSPSLRVDEAILRAKHDPASAESIYRSLIDDPELPTYAKDDAREELADHWLATDRAADAVELYREVGSRLVDDAKLRTLEVKIAAADRAALRATVLDLLVGRAGLDPDRTAAFFHLGKGWERHRGEGIYGYLAARYFVDKGRYAEAITLLQDASSASVEIPRVRAEALRLLILASCAADEKEALARAFERYSREPGVSKARLAYVARFRARCERMAQASGTFVYEGGP